MTSTVRRALGAVMSFFCVCSLPSPCSAGTIYGSWQGFEFFYEQFFVPDQPGPIISGGYIPAQFDLAYNTCTNVLSMSINDLSFSTQYGGYAEASFGPTSASGEGYYGIGSPYGLIAQADFSLTYASILPDGEIDSSIGYAVADITQTEVTPTGYGSVIYASFRPAPEPSSLMLAAVSAVGATVFWWMRASRRRGLQHERSGAPLESRA